MSSKKWFSPPDPEPNRRRQPRTKKRKLTPPPPQEDEALTRQATEDDAVLAEDATEMLRFAFELNSGSLVNNKFEPNPDGWAMRFTKAWVCPECRGGLQRIVPRGWTCKEHGNKKVGIF